jgi:hypothetical protein
MRVWPKDETMRKVLKHPSRSTVPFAAEGGAEWPDDSFTSRRLADGDVLPYDPYAGVKEETRPVEIEPKSADAPVARTAPTVTIAPAAETEEDQ